VLRDVFRKSLWEQRRALLWWTAGILGFVAITIAFFPSLKDSAAQLEDYLEQLPESLRNLFIGTESDITSPIGYLNSQVYAGSGAIVFLVFAIGAGARAIAGEEEKGTLELLLATPVTRRTVVLQKFWAMTVALGVLALALYVSLIAGGRPVGITVSPIDLLAATVHQYVFALGFGTIALAVGCLRGRKALAIGISTSVAVVAFLLNGLAPLADATAWMKLLSPFYYANGSTPLRYGFAPDHLAILLAIVVAAAIGAVWAFERRDLAIG
jgi:ABC-2 type transport system permease protein